MVLNVKIHTDSSSLLAGYMQQILKNKVVGVTKQDPCLSLNKTHQLVGHHKENSTQETAKALGITLTQGPKDKCELCAISKAKQKNSKHNLLGWGKSSNFNNKVYSDLSFTYRPYKYASHLMVDSAKGYGTDGFFNTKGNFI